VLTILKEECQYHDIVDKAFNCRNLESNQLFKKVKGNTVRVLRIRLSIKSALIKLNTGDGTNCQQLITCSLAVDCDNYCSEIKSCQVARTNHASYLHTIDVTEPVTSRVSTRRNARNARKNTASIITLCIVIALFLLLAFTAFCFVGLF